MSASRPEAHGLARNHAALPDRIKEAARATLRPVVRAAIALHLTPNTVTVVGLVVTLIASLLVASGWLLVGAAVLTAGSLLDAVDGALAREQGSGTAFGGFLDSTLDRIGEALVYIGVAGWFLFAHPDPAWPVLVALAALVGSFMVSYSRARAEGIGLSASVGVAPRTERLVLVIAGIALAGLGYEAALIAALAVIAVLTVATVAQRIWHVWRLSEGASSDSREN